MRRNNLRPADPEVLYDQYHARKYREFILSDKAGLSLPATQWSSRVTSSGTDAFTKKTISADVDQTLQLIEKNKHPHAFLWTTTPQKIKQGVRYGIIKPESITGQVIHTLGHYRMTATRRVAKGMVSNTQGVKIALLDIYQNRFEALQRLESLVNKKNEIKDYADAIRAYKAELIKIRDTVSEDLDKLPLREKRYNNLANTIIADINEDILAAQTYLNYLGHGYTSLQSANRARGNDSILEFVKRQMHRNLYELQGLNQSIVFSNDGLTRGELNDYIEDARKVIDDHQPDMRDPVIEKHHGDFTNQWHPEKKITYEFSLDELSYEEERDALLAVSFIEGWDSVDYVNNKVINNKNKDKASLMTIYATKWDTHRDGGRAIWEYLKNWVVGIFISTRPWHEGVKDDGAFLHAETLFQHTREHHPLWMNVLHFGYGIYVLIKTMFAGVYDASLHLVVSLWEDLRDDWFATEALPSWDKVKEQAEREIKKIQHMENVELGKLFGKLNHNAIPDLPEERLGTLAETEFHLSSGEYNDICNAGAKAFGGFIDHFTHGLFAKDPVGGLSFTIFGSLAMIGIASPELGKTLFGSDIVDTLDSFAKLVGSSITSKTLCGSFMIAQGPPLAIDALINGPSSTLLQNGQKFMDNPIPTVGLFAAAFGLGYLLANNIPAIHEELGSSKLLNYPVVGIKFGVMGFYLVYTDDANEYHSLEIPYAEMDAAIRKKIAVTYQDQPEHLKAAFDLLERYQFIRWLNTHASMLPKLDAKTRSDISRHITKLYGDTDEAHSLQKLIKPVKERSIAYQLFSIPCTYIFTVFKIIVSPIFSAAAWIAENPEWQEPIKREVVTLLQEIREDLVRPIVASGAMLRALVSFVASNPKALFSVFNMAAERVAVFIGEYSVSHTLYKEIAFSIHELYSRIGEFLFPARAAKSVVSADPAATVYGVVGSYGKLLNHLGVKSENCMKKAEIETKLVLVEERIEEKHDITSSNYDKEEARCNNNIIIVI